MDQEKSTAEKSRTLSSSPAALVIRGGQDQAGQIPKNNGYASLKRFINTEKKSTISFQLPLDIFFLFKVLVAQTRYQNILVHVSSTDRHLIVIHLEITPSKN